LVQGTPEGRAAEQYQEDWATYVVRRLLP